MQKKYWKFLKPGDVVDIIAPSHGYSYELKDKVEEIIINFGYRPNFLSSITNNDPFCSDCDENRLQQLGEALYSDESSAIVCIQGGYGSSRLIPYLQNLDAPEKVKPLIGFSDITALHIFLQKEWGWPSIHGSVRQRIIGNDVSSIKPCDEINDLLSGKREYMIFEGLEALNDQAQNIKQIEGEVVGGNLSLVQVSLGTFWQVDTKNKILLLEDIDERGYRIDRMLEHLSQACVFEQVKAVVFGDFTGGKEKDGNSLYKEALMRFCEKIDLPVYRCYYIGHGEINRPIPFGTKSKIENKSGQIILSCASGGKV